MAAKKKQTKKQTKKQAKPQAKKEVRAKKPAKGAPGKSLPDTTIAKLHGLLEKRAAARKAGDAKVMKGLTYDKIAAAVGCSELTVKRHWDKKFGGAGKPKAGKPKGKPAAPPPGVRLGYVEWKALGERLGFLSQIEKEAEKQVIAKLQG